MSTTPQAPAPGALPDAKVAMGWMHTARFLTTAAQLHEARQQHQGVAQQTSRLERIRRVAPLLQTLDAARQQRDQLLAQGNIALLARAEDAGLLPAGVGRAAADAYRTLRQEQHRARLNEEPTRVPDSELAAEQGAVLALWHAVFG